MTVEELDRQPVTIEHTHDDHDVSDDFDDHRHGGWGDLGDHDHRGEGDGREDLMLSYAGPWPPPHLMVTEMDGKPLVVGATAEQGTLHRVTASELNDDEADHPNIARGALYVEDPETWDGRT